MIALLVVLGIVVLLALLLVGMYNGLIQRRIRVDSAWSDIDVQLRRRYDLIPNLVNTVKGYAKHERETLEAVISARNAGVAADTVTGAAQADNLLTGALRQLFAVAEAYPDLKANQNFLALQEELAGTEGRIAYARQFYNEAVRDFDTKIATFPGVLIAGMFGMKARDYFMIEEAQARGPVNVDFGGDGPGSTGPSAPIAPVAPSAPVAPQAPPVPPANPGPAPSAGSPVPPSAPAAPQAPPVPPASAPAQPPAGPGPVAGPAPQQPGSMPPSGPTPGAAPPAS